RHSERFFLGRKFLLTRFHESTYLRFRVMQFYAFYAADALGRGREEVGATLRGRSRGRLAFYRFFRPLLGQWSDASRWLHLATEVSARLIWRLFTLALRLVRFVGHASIGAQFGVQ